jgi:hypothetical protein
MISPLDSSAFPNFCFFGFLVVDDGLSPVMQQKQTQENAALLNEQGAMPTVAICALAPSTLRMMGTLDSEPCPFCHRPCSAHVEHTYGQVVYPDQLVAPPAANDSGPDHHDLQTPMTGPDGTPVSAGSPYTVGVPMPALVIQPPVAVGYSAGEKLSLITIWSFSIVLWLHLFFFIPYCETQKVDIAAGAGGICNYYGSRKSIRVGSYYPSYTYTDTYYFIYNWYFWLIFGLTLLAYLIQCFVAPERQYLSHLLPNGIEAYIRGLVLQRPSLWFRIECYHYVTRTVRTKKGTRTERRRVTTHVAQAEYAFSSWRDISSAAVGPLNAPVKRLRCWKHYVFADLQSKIAYDQALSRFVIANDRDVHKSVTTGMELKDFHDFSLTYRVQPPMLSLGVYLMLIFTTFSVLFRHYFYSKTEPVDFHCVKEIGGGLTMLPSAPQPFGVPPLQQPYPPMQPPPQWGPPPPAAPLGYPPQPCVAAQLPQQ